MQLRGAPTPQAAAADALITAAPHAAAAAPTRTATVAIPALHIPADAAHITVLPDPLAAAAALVGGTAHGVRRQQRCYLPCCTPVAPCATQRASRRGAVRRLGAKPGLPPGCTPCHADDLLQAVSLAAAGARPADQLARQLPCSLPVPFRACTNTTSQFSLKFVPGLIGPINYHTIVDQLRAWPCCEPSARQSGTCVPVPPHHTMPLTNGTLICYTWGVAHTRSLEGQPP